MTKPSFLKRLTHSLRDEEDETSESIDHDIESAVKAVQEADVETLDAADVFSGGWCEAGEMVYIMDLAPVYEIIGSSSSRLVSATEVICTQIFAQRVSLGDGRCFFRGKQFFMHFVGADDAEGYRQAATIINDIGPKILGDRFHGTEIPGLLVVVDGADIINKDGSLNPEMLAAAIQSGGRSLAMDEPADDAPEWVKLEWNRRRGGGVALDGPAVATGSGDPAWEGGSDAVDGIGDPDWRPLNSRSDSEKRRPGGKAGARRDPAERLQRSRIERRVANLRFSGPDRRQVLDRRGRGY